MKEQGITRATYESSLKSAKARLSEIRHQTEQKYAEEQNQALKTEMKEIKKRQLMRYHSLENQLVNNVSGTNNLNDAVSFSTILRS